MASIVAVNPENDYIYFMLGVIAGDVIGSRFEWAPIKTIDFSLFHPLCSFTSF